MPLIARVPDALASPLPSAACRSCRTPTSASVHLVHEGVGEAIDVCPRCVRSTMRMKADLGDERGRLLLLDYAEEYAWQVWRSEHALYLIPSISPFVVRTAASAMESAGVATRG